MGRMNLINTKKDELTIAIKGLTDLTQQLVQAYAAQMQVIEQLTTRLQAGEETDQWGQRPSRRTRHAQRLRPSYSDAMTLVVHA